MKVFNYLTIKEITKGRKAYKKSRCKKKRMREDYDVWSDTLIAYTAGKYHVYRETVRKWMSKCGMRKMFYTASEYVDHKPISSWAEDLYSAFSKKS